MVGASRRWLGSECEWPSAARDSCRAYPLLNWTPFESAPSTRTACWAHHEALGLRAAENAVCVCDGGERGAFRQKGSSDQPYLWARLDRKPNKQAEKRFKNFLHSKGNPKEFFWNVEEDFKPAPECWIPAKEIEQINGNPVPDENGHIPGLGSKKHPLHLLIPHGAFQIRNLPSLKHNHLLSWFEGCKEGKIEGIVWHCSDGCLIKVHRHHLGLCWPIPDTYMNSRPVIINMNLNKCDSAFDIKCLFNHFSKIDNQKFARLKDIIFDV
ncbi:uncharacterized protein C12orf29 homolog isoform X3 [Cebus imitator]|uniref:uncharacterized protein C12orf29 homolog isoform X3 n=1 Tax=Cebus imitator TaxID=2715852 RepID=UPI00080A322A|nr:uncharacterized protein C12orf29 homolog isoform X3 [Cebus imitator]